MFAPFSLDARAVSAEQQRLAEAEARTKHWKRWGPYLAERAWGTVREDYSPNRTAWEFFPHDHARSRVYRWNCSIISTLLPRILISRACTSIRTLASPTRDWGKRINGARVSILSSSVGRYRDLERRTLFRHFCRVRQAGRRRHSHRDHDCESRSGSG
jgi:hypothetical protein